MCLAAAGGAGVGAGVGAGNGVGTWLATAGGGGGGVGQGGACVPAGWNSGLGMNRDLGGSPFHAFSIIFNSLEHVELGCGMQWK